MKKSVIFSLLVMLILVLAACTGAPAPTPAAPAESSGAAQATTPAESAATAAPAPATEAPAAEGAGAMTPKKGGSITVVYKDDLATLDPAIGYDWTNWPAIKLVFDGLLDYDEGTTVEPRIAESLPEVNADSTVYTFKLKKGVKFSN